MLARSAICLRCKRQWADVSCKPRACAHSRAECLEGPRRPGRPLLGIAAAQALAASRGGMCLSENYKDTKSNLRWRCARQHEWEAKLGPMRYAKSWCPHCVGTARLGLDVAQNVAKSHGGLCLSDVYVNVKTPLTWQCASGHEWHAPLAYLRTGRWCPQCAGAGVVEKALQEARELAAEKRGTCISRGYVNVKAPLQWQCTEGHAWCAALANVKRGTWCPHCAHNAPLHIGIAESIALVRGGRCLSELYVNARSLLHWQCSWGHRWFAALSDIKNKETWCPYCSAGKSEQSVRSIFETIFHGWSFPRCRPKFLQGHRGRRLELDGYCAGLALAFEYHGEQHYRRDNFFNRSGRDFDECLQRDLLKLQLCQGAQVRLVVVPYAVKDRWNFIRICLLQWFSLRAIFLTALQP